MVDQVAEEAPSQRLSALENEPQAGQSYTAREDNPYLFLVTLPWKFIGPVAMGIGMGRWQR